MPASSVDQTDGEAGPWFTSAAHSRASTPEQIALTSSARRACPYAGRASMAKACTHQRLALFAFLNFTVTVPDVVLPAFGLEEENLPLPRILYLQLGPLELRPGLLHRQALQLRDLALLLRGSHWRRRRRRRRAAAARTARPARCGRSCWRRTRRTTARRRGPVAIAPGWLPGGGHGKLVRDRAAGGHAADLVRRRLRVPERSVGAGGDARRLAAAGRELGDRRRWWRSGRSGSRRTR